MSKSKSPKSFPVKFPLPDVVWEAVSSLFISRTEPKDRLQMQDGTKIKMVDIGIEDHQTRTPFLATLIEAISNAALKNPDVAPGANDELVVSLRGRGIGVQPPLNHNQIESRDG